MLLRVVVFNQLLVTIVGLWDRYLARFLDIFGVSEYGIDVDLWVRLVEVSDKYPPSFLENVGVWDGSVVYTLVEEYGSRVDELCVLA